MAYELPSQSRKLNKLGMLIRDPRVDTKYNNRPCQAYLLACFDQNIINIKCQIKSMMYTVLKSHAYDNILAIKCFCTSTNFSCTCICRF